MPGIRSRPKPIHKERVTGQIIDGEWVLLSLVNHLDVHESDQDFHPLKPYRKTEE